MSVPRASCKLALRPAVLNVWQGGPPTRTSSSPFLMPSLFLSSAASTVLMSASSIMRSSGSLPSFWFNRMVSQKGRIFSTQAKSLNRSTCARPTSNPIPPENRETAVNCFFTIKTLRVSVLVGLSNFRRPIGDKLMFFSNVNCCASRDGVDDIQLGIPRGEEEHGIERRNIHTFG